MWVKNLTVCDRTLTAPIDTVRRPSPQAVVGNAHPTKKLDQ